MPLKQEAKWKAIATYDLILSLETLRSTLKQLASQWVGYHRWNVILEPTKRRFYLTGIHKRRWIP